MNKQLIKLVINDIVAIVEAMEEDERFKALPDSLMECTVMIYCARLIASSMPCASCARP
jgi:hypothetical protein